MNISTVGAVTFDNIQVTFSWIDYSFFFVMLSLSVLIGFYFGCWGHQDSADEYLLGGKKMSAFPVGASLVASNISGIALLGAPADIYQFGATFYVYVLMLIPVCLLTYYVYIPVFYKLQVVSAYEYLMVRFDRKTRLLASGLYVLNTLLYLPIVVYMPALALAQATHINLHYITPLVCGVCILYTTIGGLKAVIWTDALQFVVMIGSIIGVFYIGVNNIGGLGVIWERAVAGERLDIDLDIDPTKRDTLLATAVGTMCMGFSYAAINQSFIQKTMSLPNMKEVKKSVILFYSGLLFIFTMVLGIGLLMYAKYHECDPFTAGKITKQDQVLPFYVMEVATVIPGLAGLFLSGILSAALSTLSACMNSLAASVYEDFVSSYIPPRTSEKTISNILKFMVVLIGLFSTLFVYAVEHMGNIFPLNLALNSITCGPLLGLFTLGMMFPMANAKGALYGSVLSLLIVSFIIGGNQVYQIGGNLHYETKPVSIEGCNGTVNRTIPSNSSNGKTSGEDIFVLFRISHYYYTFSGAVLTMLAGLLISTCTRQDTDPKVDPDTISPIVYWLKKKFRKGRDKAQETEIKEAVSFLANEKVDSCLK